MGEGGYFTPSFPPPPVIFYLLQRETKSGVYVFLESNKIKDDFRGGGAELNNGNTINRIMGRKGGGEVKKCVHLAILSFSDN